MLKATIKIKSLQQQKKSLVYPLLNLIIEVNANIVILLVVWYVNFTNTRWGKSTVSRSTLARYLIIGSPQK